jgi:hypothetical protein
VSESLHVVIQCPRCHTRFQPPGQISDVEAFNAFADAVGLMRCPRCSGHVILSETTTSFVPVSSPQRDLRDHKPQD